MGSSDHRVFSLLENADYLYEANARRLALRAETRQAFEGWREEALQALRGVLGIPGDRPPRFIKAERIQSIERETYQEEKYALLLEESVEIPLYLLIPKNLPPPYKTILALPGHDPSVKTILGYSAEEAGHVYDLREEPVDVPYAKLLANEGYMVCALEQRGFGERITVLDPNRMTARSCRHLSVLYSLIGRSLLGERCWDCICVLNYLETRGDVDTSFLGCTGQSGGGTTALYLTALDERISVAVLSACFSSFARSILASEHCECNYIPGLLGLFEMGDLAAMIAPRPLRLVVGERDLLFPADGAREQFAAVLRAYALYGMEDKCSLLSHPEGHAYDFPASKEWFKTWWREP